VNAQRDVTLGGKWPATIVSPESERAETLIERGKAEIRAHVAAGIVPATVTGFDALHNYVDANCYAGLCDEYLYDFLRETDVPSEVQDALHHWIVTGGLVNADLEAAADAAALAAPQAPRAVVLNWIGMPTLEVDIDVILMDGRALVTRSTLDLMAESVRTSELASPEEDAAYADSILATPQRSDGFYDVTDEPALDDQLIEYGIGRASDLQASL
jgi:hypothetical protein